MRDRPRFRATSPALGLLESTNLSVGRGTALAIHEVAPEWEVEHVDRMLQSKTAMDAIRAAKSPDDVLATCKPPLATFAAKRERFLLY